MKTKSAIKAGYTCPNKCINGELCVWDAENLEWVPTGQTC